MWGRHVHEAVLASGASFSGPTIHFVDEKYDTGSILAQWPVPVLPWDKPDSLAARVLRIEHILYPLAADHLCRAVDEGIPVSRFSFPGEAVRITDTFSRERVVDQIDKGFKLARQ